MQESSHDNLVRLKKRYWSNVEPAYADRIMHTAWIMHSAMSVSTTRVVDTQGGKSAEHGEKDARGDRGANDACDVRSHGVHKQKVAGVTFKAYLIDDPGRHRNS